MVEGGSILHADHPRKWVIFARRFTPYIAVHPRLKIRQSILVLNIDATAR